MLLKADTETFKKLKNICIKNNYSPVFHEISQDTSNYIFNLINEVNPHIVFLDPLLKISTNSVTKKFKDTLFFTLGKVSDIWNRKNFLSIEFDKIESYRQAGSIAGKIIESRALDNDNERPIKFGVLVYPFNEEGNKANNSLISGFLHEAGEDKIIYREIESIADNAKIKKIMDDMKKEGVHLFFLKVFSKNSFCLEYLEREGGYAIIEDYSGLFTYKDIVLFSITNDIPEALTFVFKNINSDYQNVWEKNNIILPQKLIQGELEELPDLY